MLRVEGTVIVHRSPEEVLEWVVDLERYRRADTKITKVIRQSDDRVIYRGRLRGIPTPADENLVQYERGKSLTFRGAPRWTRHVLDFEGSFHCHPVDGGTRLVHTEQLGFKPWPVRIAMEAWLRSWLEREIVDEMERIRQLVEKEPT